MKKKRIVSIGIPAYNEGANIKVLLQTLLRQSAKNYVLQEIIVVSDGSTDDTVKKVLELKKSEKVSVITVLDDGKRLGKSARLCQIFKKATGDTIFVMDADITIADKMLLDTLMQKTDFKKAGLMSVSANPLPAVSQFEKIVNAGVAVMKDIRSRWNNGNNYLSFKGCFLGLDTSFAKSLHPAASLVSNDAFLYFSAIGKGFSPVYFENIAVYYRSPSDFADHLKQTSRYRSIKEELQKYFSFAIQTEPLPVMLISTLRTFIKEPVYVPAYLLLRVLTKLMREKKVKSRWDIAGSTKRILTSSL